MSQQNFMDGLHLSLDQANLYEKETRNQADNLMLHKLIAQILIEVISRISFAVRKILSHLWNTSWRKQFKQLQLYMDLRMKKV